MPILSMKCSCGTLRKPFTHDYSDVLAVPIWKCPKCGYRNHLDVVNLYVDLFKSRTLKVNGARVYEDTVHQALEESLRP